MTTITPAPKTRRAPVPGPLRALIWCGVVSIAALFAMPIVMTFDRAGVEATIRAENPGLDPGRLESAWLGTLAYSYGLHIIAAAVFIWLGRKVLARRDWARIALSLVLVFALGASLVSATAGTMYLWAVVIGDATYLVGLILLWTPASIDYCRSGAPAPATSRRRTWIAVLVWTLGSFLAAGALLAAQPGLGLSMEILSLVMLAPAIGALVCLLTVRKHLPRIPKPVPAGRFAGTVLVSLGTVVIYFVAISVLRGHPPEIPATVAGAPVAVMITAQAIGALTEEIGFRGVLFHAAASRMPRLVSALIVGVLFGLWHVQYFGLDPVQHLSFIGGTIGLTLTMVHVMAGSFWQRMVPCTIIHLGANLALAFTGGDEPPMTVFGLTIVIGLLVTAPAGWFLNRRGTVAPQAVPSAPAARQ